ncbi:TerD family protein [Streptomyces sp. NPDC092296]|uniref:TerD family protein n=1 Tax=Streptomyces sp. NPDC092296 TaxID=3366012 RepID=UPI00381B60D5
MARELLKAARVRVSDLTPADDLYIGVRLSAPGLTLDISCFGLDAAERLSDDRYFIFFNQPASPEQSIRLLGAQSGDSESFRLLLSQVPEAVHRISFTAAIDGAGQMSQVASGYVRIVAGGEEVGRYAFTGAEFSTERAVMLADIYRKNGEWRFCAIGQGFDGGLRALLENYGGEVLEDEPAAEPAPASVEPAPVPAPPPAPAQPAAVPAQPGPPELPRPAPPDLPPPPPGVKVSLVKYAEVPEQSGWVQQNPHLVRVTVTKDQDVLALHGSMVAYQGKADFAHESSGMLRKLTANATGQQLKLMRVSGEGQVFLADEASHLHLVQLEGDALCVSADRVLAFDAGIEHEVRRIEGEGLPGGALYTLMFSGRGTLVVKTNGVPVMLPVTPAPETYADVNALVAWTRGSQVITTAPVRIQRSAYAGHAGESYSLQFRGAPGNFIVVQPFEV